MTLSTEIVCAHKYIVLILHSEIRDVHQLAADGWPFPSCEVRSTLQCQKEKGGKNFWNAFRKTLLE